MLSVRMIKYSVIICQHFLFFNTTANAVQFRGIKADLTEDSSLVGHWKLDEGNGLTARDSANTNDGNLINMNSQDWVDGKVGNFALDFDGVNDYVEIGNGTANLYTGYTAITVAAWAYSNENSANGAPLVGNWWDGSNRSWRLYLSSYSGTHYGFNVSTDSQNDNDTALSGATNKFQAWVHVVGTWDSGDDTIRIYIDGVEKGTQAQAGDTVRTNTSPTWLGAHWYAGTPQNYWKERTDDVRIYNRALSADEVMDLYTRTSGDFIDYTDWTEDTACVGAWRFDEGAGYTATDISGRGNHGTLTNMDSATDWVDGQENDCLDFDGANDYIDLNTGSYNPSTVSICAWIYPESTDTNRMIVANESPTDNFQGYALYIPSSADVQFEVAGSAATGSSNTSITANEWTHVVGIWDGSDTIIYKNGILADQDNFGVAVDGSGSDWYIGYEPTGTADYFDGKIDEVAIFDKVLTDAEVADLYKFGLR